MDVMLAIGYILEDAQFGGCTDKNSQEQYEKEIRWEDDRIPKPTWQEILAAWEIRKDIVIIEPKSELELKIEELELKIKINEEEIDKIKEEK